MAAVHHSLEDDTLLNVNLIINRTIDGGRAISVDSENTIFAQDLMYIKTNTTRWYGRNPIQGHLGKSSNANIGYAVWLI